MSGQGPTPPLALVGLVQPLGRRPSAAAAPHLSQAIRLTHTPAQEFGPAIAPDGTWVTYYANSGGRTDVWVKDLDSGGVLNVTSSLNLDLPVRTGIGGLSISPDGRQIAFAARPEPAFPQYDVWTIPGRLGGAPRKLVPASHPSSGHPTDSESSTPCRDPAEEIR